MHTYSGVVTPGSKKAQTLGFPTANIPYNNPSLSGIYAGRAAVGNKEHNAAIFVDTQRKFLEAYLLDFSGDLYGKEMRVTLLEKIREYENFTDDAALKKAIANDVAKTRAYFSRLA